MTLGQPGKLTDAGGPALTVTFTSDRPLRVQGSPPKLYEVLYLRDGIIVGGGPMLNRSGNLTPQGLDLIGYGFDVDPSRPYTVDTDRRDTLCPDQTWPAVWSEPHSYQVVLVQGPVVPGPGGGPDQVLLDTRSNTRKSATESIPPETATPTRSPADSNSCRRM